MSLTSAAKNTSAILQAGNTFILKWYSSAEINTKSRSVRRNQSVIDKRKPGIKKILFFKTMRWY